MWKIIKGYYLFPFVGFLILLTIKTIGIKSPNTPLQNLLILMGGALLLAAIVGTIYYFLDTKWGPRKREKRFGKPPFRELLQQGFTRVDHFLAGTAKGYTVVVQFVWPGGKSAIRVDVLFDPRPLGSILSQQDLKELEKRYRKSSIWNDQRYEWTANSLGLLMPYNFSPPKAQAVLEKAKELVDILTRERLQPITLEQTEELARLQDTERT